MFCRELLSSLFFGSRGLLRIWTVPHEVLGGVRSSDCLPQRSEGRWPKFASQLKQALLYFWFALLGNAWSFHSSVFRKRRETEGEDSVDRCASFSFWVDGTGRSTPQLQDLAGRCGGGSQRCCRRKRRLGTANNYILTVSWNPVVHHQCGRAWEDSLFPNSFAGTAHFLICGTLGEFRC